MTAENTYSEKLFSYGTLQYEHVQLSTFGRKLNGKKDILIAYQLLNLKINDPKVVETSGEAIHPVLMYTGKKDDRVEGTVFDISLAELESADSYEVAEYKRVSIVLHSGAIAWVYVSINSEEMAVKETV